MRSRIRSYDKFIILRENMNLNLPIYFYSGNVIQSYNHTTS